ncbi:hypothetical protein V6N13_001063 [Hibiscus sabdariffa]|uniref:Uncharacterized protein n=1 Tax=Hibiscus sabdariffa TaxID=183260 RepID=A0ABR2G7K0_9ROSI
MAGGLQQEKIWRVKPLNSIEMMLEQGDRVAASEPKKQGESLHVAASEHGDSNVVMDAHIVDQAIDVVVEQDVKIDVANQNDAHVADIGPVAVEIDHVEDHAIEVVAERESCTKCTTINLYSRMRC